MGTLQVGTLAYGSPGAGTAQYCPLPPQMTERMNPISISGVHLEADLFHLDPGVIGILMPLQAADHEVITEEAGVARQPGNIQWFHSIDAESVDVLRVIRTEPMLAPSAGPVHSITFAERDLVTAEMDGGICLHDLEGVLAGDRAYRDGRLEGIRGFVDGGQLCGNRRRVAHRCGSVLKLAADHEAEPSFAGFHAGAGQVVEAGLIGPSVVIHDRLAEVKAIVQDVSVDLSHAGVHACFPDRGRAIAGQLGCQFPAQACVDLDGFRRRGGGLQRFLGQRQHVRQRNTCPRAQADIGGRQVAQIVEAQGCGVDPTVHWNVRRTGGAGGCFRYLLMRGRWFPTLRKRRRLEHQNRG